LFFVLEKFFVFVLGSSGQKSEAVSRCYSKRLNSREVSIANRGKLRLKLLYRYQDYIFKDHYVSIIAEKMVQVNLPEAFLYKKSIIAGRFSYQGLAVGRWHFFRKDM